MGFASDIKLFCEKTKLAQDLVLRKVTLDMSRALINRSPVDTGRFRGNWMLGIGGVDASTVEIAGEGSSTASKSGLNLQDTDSASEERIVAKLGEIKFGGIIYITNSLPYAIPLEYGHSGQAPAGMVRLTVREYSQFIEAAVRKYKV